jgi:quercetin dioxygenase-like cupin family protein
MTAAFASPPSGQSSFKDHARAQVAEKSTLKTPAGTEVVSASYTLAPGADTGWRSHAGQSVFAVSSGNLTLHDAAGCTTKEYPAGQAAVMAPGRYLIHNTGHAPLKFVGAFLNLAAGTPWPLVEGAGETAPTNCEGIAGYAAGRPSGASVTDHARGGFVQANAYGHSLRGTDVIEVEASKDMLVSSYHAEPGASTGWMHHAPALNIITRGTVTYYEAHDGKCMEAGKYTRGQAYNHAHADRHSHMAVNEGNEAVESTAIYFNLPHGNPIPVVGGQADAFDFSPLPSTDCPRVR